MGIPFKSFDIFFSLFFSKLFILLLLLSKMLLLLLFSEILLLLFGISVKISSCLLLIFLNLIFFFRLLKTQTSFLLIIPLHLASALIKVFNNFGLFLNVFTIFYKIDLKNYFT
jgi:hypothetical protein